jgi:uncharacterized membrane-anchored protein YhcB (DUF1043 family)
MAKLQYSYLQLTDEYRHLWNHTYAESAESELYNLMSRERELSELAATEAPNDQDRMDKWETHVFKQHDLLNA